MIGKDDQCAGLVCWLHRPFLGIAFHHFTYLVRDILCHHLSFAVGEELGHVIGQVATEPVERLLHQLRVQ